MNESGCELQNVIYKDGTMPIHCVNTANPQYLMHYMMITYNTLQYICEFQYLLHCVVIIFNFNYSCMLVSIILLMQVNFHYVYLPLSVSTIMKRREVDSCKSNWCGEGGA